MICTAFLLIKIKLFHEFILAWYSERIFKISNHLMFWLKNVLLFFADLFWCHWGNWLHHWQTCMYSVKDLIHHKVGLAVLFMALHWICVFSSQGSTVFTEIQGVVSDNMNFFSSCNWNSIPNFGTNGILLDSFYLKGIYH